MANVYPSNDQNDYIITRLLDNPREDLDVEYKSWININNNEGKANLAQAILASANYGGGYVIIGFKELEGKLVPDENRPSDIQVSYSQDIINGIVEKYAEPSFHCSVSFPAASDGNTYPVIQVPGDHGVPIRAKAGGPDNKHLIKDVYYMRQPGPCSDRIKSGSAWKELIHRCLVNHKDELLGDFRRIMRGESVSLSISPSEKTLLEDWTSESLERFSVLYPDKEASPFSLGFHYISYRFAGVAKNIELKELCTVIEKAKLGLTGWPLWVSGINDQKPYAYNNAIECKWDSRGLTSDFWRANGDPSLFIVRPYWEDYDNEKPGSVFNLVIPIWRVAESLLHSKRLADLLQIQNTEVQFMYHWEGLSGRKLTSNKYDPFLNFLNNKSQQDSVKSYIKVTIEDIVPNLPDIIDEALKELYLCFDFFKLNRSVIESELGEMKQRGLYRE